MYSHYNKTIPRFVSRDPKLNKTPLAASRNEAVAPSMPIGAPVMPAWGYGPPTGYQTATSRDRRLVRQQLAPAPLPSQPRVHVGKHAITYDVQPACEPRKRRQAPLQKCGKKARRVDNENVLTSDVSATTSPEINDAEYGKPFYLESEQKSEYAALCDKIAWLQRELQELRSPRDHSPLVDVTHHHHAESLFKRSGIIPGLDDTPEEKITNSSKVEVIEAVEDAPGSAEIDGDDVIYEADPVVEVVVEDDDTDDETAQTRAERDRDAAEIIRIKQEPIDPDDEPILVYEGVVRNTLADTTLTVVTSGLDGNAKLDATPISSAACPKGIRINIKSVINEAVTKKKVETVIEEKSLRPLQEPRFLKPGLEGKHLNRQTPVMRGNEQSGLCSIM